MEKKEEKNKSDETIEEVKEKSGEENIEEKKCLKDELDLLNDKYLRLNAEYSNFKKRTEKEKIDIYKYANEKLIVDLLPFLDNMQRAIDLSKDSKDDKTMVDGINLMKKSFDEFLSKQGVELIEAKDKEFDPNMHHAVLSEEADGVEEGIVLEELQSGYTLNGKVIRPAMVKVSK